MKDMKGQKAITRRGFLKGATVAGGAIAGVALVSATGESQTPPDPARGNGTAKPTLLLWDRARRDSRLLSRLGAARRK
jgi:hypothetical protein